jgi:hypothetical protein
VAITDPALHLRSETLLVIERKLFSVVKIFFKFEFGCDLGGPRGQGQEKETIVARRHKTENKTRGANHNRRYMADRKRREF